MRGASRFPWRLLFRNPVPFLRRASNRLTKPKGNTRKQGKILTGRPVSANKLRPIPVQPEILTLCLHTIAKARELHPLRHHRTRHLSIQMSRVIPNGMPLTTEPLPGNSRLLHTLMPLRTIALGSLATARSYRPHQRSQHRARCLSRQIIHMIQNCHQLQHNRQAS